MAHDGPAFFALKDAELVPAPHARGPWSPDMLHGRLLGGLAARALEAEHGDPEFRFARLTVDLFRNSPLLPLRVETTRVREGRRIRVADAVVTTEQGLVARASAVLLRRAAQPPGEAWPPPSLEPPDLTVPGAPGDWNLPFDIWGADGWSGPGPYTAWVRETRQMVEGEELSPFVCVALAADFASPLTNSGTEGLNFINADYTITLARLPVGEAIGLESRGHLSDDGIATGSATIHDVQGPIGFCQVTAVANGATPSAR
ncbi:thioesterase family protein [Sphaerisporangium sp. NPDC051011]|uniref:thioesterase family protein n=1 Tax=Sphaerisporangium sp. NPDC051011 TaxID=3155792 RepID=UPI0033D17B38